MFELLTRCAVEPTFGLSPAHLESTRCAARLEGGTRLAHTRLVMLVTDHDDTAELYRFGLERAGFGVQRSETIDEALAVCRARNPIAIVVHFRPRQDATTVGTALRTANPGAVLIGLFSIQLSIGSLRRVLEHLDDAILIPCAPEALAARVVRRLQERRHRQASA